MDGLTIIEAESENGAINSFSDEEINEKKDTLKIYFSSAIQKLKNHADFNQKMQASGLPWRGVQYKLENLLPETMERSGKPSLQSCSTGIR